MKRCQVTVLGNQNNNTGGNSCFVLLILVKPVYYKVGLNRSSFLLREGSVILWLKYTRHIVFCRTAKQPTIIKRKQFDSYFSKNGQKRIYLFQQI